MPIRILFSPIWLHDHLIFRECNFESIHIFTLSSSAISSSQGKFINSAFCADGLQRWSLGLRFPADHLPFGTCCSPQCVAPVWGLLDGIALEIWSARTLVQCFQSVMVKRPLGFFWSLEKYGRVHRSSYLKFNIVLLQQDHLGFQHSPSWFQIAIALWSIYTVILRHLSFFLDWSTAAVPSLKHQSHVLLTSSNCLEKYPIGCFLDPK